MASYKVLGCVVVYSELQCNLNVGDTQRSFWDGDRARSCVRKKGNLIYKGIK